MKYVKYIISFIVFLFILIIIIRKNNNDIEYFNKVLHQDFSSSIEMDLVNVLRNGPLESQPFGVFRITIDEILINKDSLKKYFLFYKQHPIHNEAKEIINRIIFFIESENIFEDTIDIVRISNGFWCFDSEDYSHNYVVIYDRNKRHLYLFFEYLDDLPDAIKQENNKQESQYQKEIKKYVN